MIIRQRPDIKWGDRLNMYIYGTKVTYHSDSHVSIYNPLIPSGTKIQGWVSHTNYQAARKQPSLPLLKRKQEYQLIMKFDCQPKKGVYTSITFFDRYGDVIEEKIEKHKSFTFTYPEDAHTYQVHLLSAGFESLDFYSFSIEEINRD